MPIMTRSIGRSGLPTPEPSNHSDHLGPVYLKERDCFDIRDIENPPQTDNDRKCGSVLVHPTRRTSASAARSSSVVSREERDRVTIVVDDYGHKYFADCPLYSKDTYNQEDNPLQISHHISNVRCICAESQRSSKLTEMSLITQSSKSPSATIQSKIYRLFSTIRDGISSPCCDMITECADKNPAA